MGAMSFRSAPTATRFMKDVRTLADTGELAHILASVRELLRDIEAADKIAAQLVPPSNNISGVIRFEKGKLL